MHYAHAITFPITLRYVGGQSDCQGWSILGGIGGTAYSACNSVSCPCFLTHPVSLTHITLTSRMLSRACLLYLSGIDEKKGVRSRISSGLPGRFGINWLRMIGSSGVTNTRNAQPLIQHEKGYTVARATVQLGNTSCAERNKLCLSG